MNAIARLESEHKNFKNYAVRKAAIELEYPEMFEDRSIGDKLNKILENGEIRTVFQPIVSLKDGQVLGFEALCRGPKDTIFENPGKLFEAASIYGKLWDLELLCRVKALEIASKKINQYNIFLNVDPNIINDEKFKKGFTKEYLEMFNINPQNIIFEITEKNSVQHIDNFHKLIEHYKQQGYNIAIDDTGSGYSGLKLITDINPHYIKLDITLVKDIDKDPVKYSLIKTLNDFCNVTNIKVIAEGIETENELNALIDIGVDYGQGFLLQRPLEEFNGLSKDILEKIYMRNKKKSKYYYSRTNTVFVGDLCKNNPYVSPSDINKKVYEIFTNNPALRGVPVVENDTQILTGLIMKDCFFEKLGTQFGYSVFYNRPVTLIMDKRPLTVDYETTIDVASKLAMNRRFEKTYDYIIILKNNRYFGVITVKDLLEKAIELEVNYAKHLNPLSGLPGNVLIEQKLKELIKIKANYTVLYLDIDNFKVYNDIYGFEKGDCIIQFLSRIIAENTTPEYHDAFIGHIGGDDFIIVTADYNVENLCNNILNAFEKGIKNFYFAEDIEKGYIYAKDRYGVERKFNLLTLSIAGVANKERDYKDNYQLAEFASKIKKLCKQSTNNCYVIGGIDKEFDKHLLKE